MIRPRVPNSASAARIIPIRPNGELRVAEKYGGCNAFPVAVFQIDPRAGRGPGPLVNHRFTSGRPGGFEVIIFGETAGFEP